MFLKKEEGEVSPEKLTRIYFWGRGHLIFFQVQEMQGSRIFWLRCFRSGLPKFPRKADAAELATEKEEVIAAMSARRLRREAFLFFQSKAKSMTK